jgi:hypothetical protein
MTKILIGTFSFQYITTHEFKYGKKYGTVTNIYTSYLKALRLSQERVGRAGDRGAYT